MQPHDIFSTFHDEIAKYHSLFPTPFTLSHHALHAYHALNRVTCGFHIQNKDNPDLLDYLFISHDRTPFTVSEMSALEKYHAKVPSVVGKPCDWTNFDTLGPADRRRVCAFLSIVYYHGTKLAEKENAKELIPMFNPPEFQWILHRFPNLIFMAVRLGERVPTTKLHAIDQIYVITDPNLSRYWQ